DDICSKMGCRMLTCNEYNEHDEFGDDIDIYSEADLDNQQKSDWFTGSCAFCLNQIPYKHWAVRRPLATSGFTSCYCSIDCIKADTKSSQESVMTLINLFEEQLNLIGIQDRLYK